MRATTLLYLRIALWVPLIGACVLLVSLFPQYRKRKATPHFTHRETASGDHVQPDMALAEEMLASRKA